MRTREDVAFLVPRTRSIAATIELGSDSSSRNVRAELIPSAAGDPLLPPGEVPDGVTHIVLSRSTAQKLHVEPGDTLLVQAEVVGPGDTYVFPTVAASGIDPERW